MSLQQVFLKWEIIIPLKEPRIVISNPSHKLAEMQYWYAETFRIRQLYTDAASAYLKVIKIIHKVIKHLLIYSNLEYL